MELIQFLISLFTTDEGRNLIAQVFNTFFGSPPQDDSPDPEIDEIFEQIVKNKKSPILSIGEGYALVPVANIADGEIISRLTRYFGRV